MGKDRGQDLGNPDSVLAEYARLELVDAPRPESLLPNPDTAGVAGRGGESAEIVLAADADRILSELTLSLMF